MSSDFRAMLAAVDRPLPLRRRPDLVAAEQWFGGRRWMVIHDPVTQAYSYLTDEEHFILAALDCRASLAEILERYARRFAPRQLGAGELQAYLAELHRSGLVLSERPGQGAELVARRRAKASLDWLQWLESVLAFRWRGINPEPCLARIDPLAGWLFSPLGLALWLVIVGLAATLLVVNGYEFRQRMPDASRWLAGGNLVWLAAATIGVKTLHELGHALAARRVGSRCREIGVQWFFLLPCLYSNVSDTWLVRSKWQRILVSAAGIYVEILLAAIAAILWWAAEPGVLASLGVSVIVVASAGTLLLNGNPLMRYDGYYILSDWLEIPNLEQRSRGQLVAWLARWTMGAQWQPPEELDHAPRPWLAAYAAAAIAYRILVLVGVYFFLRSILDAHRLAAVADALFAGAALGMLLPLAAAAGQFVRDARSRRDLSPRRMAVSAIVAAVLVAVLVLVPLPQRVTAPAVIEPAAATQVYVTVAGQLLESTAPGARVHKGQIVARLDNPELRRDLARLTSEARQQSLHIAELEALRGDHPDRSAALPAARQSLADLESRIAHVQQLLDQLTLTAPQDGVVLPPPQRKSAAARRSLATWSGTPLDAANQGSFLETGTVVCLVARPGSLDAVAVVDQSRAPLIRPASRAVVASRQYPHGPLTGRVRQVAHTSAEELPEQLAAIAGLPERHDAAGRRQPLQTVYQVRIEISGPPSTLLPGSAARVRIDAPRETLAIRLGRWLAEACRPPPWP